MMDFSSIKEIIIPEGKVQTILVNESIIWKKQIDEEYLFTEYLQFNGNMAFDTGVVCTHNTKIEVEFTREQTGKMLYGVKSSDNTASVTAHMNNGGYWRFGNAYFTGTPNNTKNIAVVNNTGVLLNGIQYKYNSVVNDFETPNTLTVGAAKEVSGELGTTLFVGKVYYFKIYESDELILDYVPCEKANGEKGFWDNISQKFIAPILYVEASMLSNEAIYNTDIMEMM